MIILYTIISITVSRTRRYVHTRANVSFRYAVINARPLNSVLVNCSVLCSKLRIIVAIEGGLYNIRVWTVSQQQQQQQQPF